MNGVAPDLYFAVGIDGFDEQPDGSVLVYGIPCNPDTLDVDGQGANPDWLKQALGRWWSTGPNLREMHQPSAVGVGKQLDWQGDVPYLTAKAVDPAAARKVREGVYRAFSIGVKNHQLNMRNPRFPKGEIVGGDIVEVSLVDRPAIPGSDILDFKGDLFKIATAISDDEILDHQQGVVWRRVATITEGAEMSGKTAGADLGKRDIDPNVGGGVDRDKIPAADFAGKDRSYPIVKPGDVSDAASSIGRAGPDNYSSEQLKENIIRIAHRKGAAYVAELPEAWKKEDKVADPTEKTADAEKTIDAAAEKTASHDHDHEREDEDEVEKSPLAKLEEKAARTAFCPDCGKGVEIEQGKTVADAKGNEFLVGKDAAGHELRKFVAPDEAKAAGTDAGKDAADGDECDMPDGEKTVDADTGKNARTVDPDGDGDDDSGDKAAEKTTVAASASQADLIKAALLDVLAEAGIDLGKAGRRMAKARLNRFHAAIDELKTLAAELEHADDLGKAAQAGSDLYTRMEACIAEINGLARQMANPGDDVDGDPGDTSMGAAPGIRPDTMTLHRATGPDLTKNDTSTSPRIEDVAAELAKSVAPALEKALQPLVGRLEQVEHTVRPASPPVLAVEERGHAFVGKTADARRMAVEEASAELAKMSDSEREKLAAAVLAGRPDWRR